MPNSGSTLPTGKLHIDSFMLRKTISFDNVWCMTLSDYLKKLNLESKIEFAKRCETSIGFLKLVALGYKPCSPELAVRVDRESKGEVSCEALCPEPKIDWAYLQQKYQHSQCSHQPG